MSQALLPLQPAPDPLPPVVDQRVARRERPSLQRMSREILAFLRERGTRGAFASEIYAMFPGARSVRTRISDVRRFIELSNTGETWHVRPASDKDVGDWWYAIWPPLPGNAR